MIDPFAVLALGGPVEASEDPVVSQELSATGLLLLDTTGISFGAFLSGLGCLVGWGGGVLILVGVECVRCPWNAGINVVAIVLGIIFLSSFFFLLSPLLFYQKEGS